jgi:putative flippase GtrA
MVDTITVEVVVPVYNEQRALPGCIQVLHRYLDDNLDYDWTITIVDNASTDDTTGVETALAHDYDRVGLIRLTHSARCSDARCGFKAARTDAVRSLLDHVEDNGWFFDTELLLLAEYNGLRIHEVPVDWIEDTDTRMQVASTAFDDIKGLVRGARAKASGRAVVVCLPQRPEPRPAHPDAVVSTKDTRMLSQFLLFAIIGVLSTLANAVLYAVTRGWFSPLVANFVALTVTTVLNTEANRRVTFTAGRQSVARAHLQGLILFTGYYLLTSGALLALDAAVAHPARWLEVLVLLGSSALGTVLRFVALRLWVFKDNKGSVRS